MTVNHADALDYAPDGPMSAWAWEAEEHQTVPVSCGHLSIRASMPIFDWVYLEKFEQRLMLAAAEITGRAENALFHRRMEGIRPSGSRRAGSGIYNPLR